MIKVFSNFFYDFVKITGIIPAEILMGPHVYFTDQTAKQIIKKDGALIIANHSSFCDPISIMTAFPLRRIEFMASVDLFNNPLSRFFFKNVNCIEVNKNDFSMKTFHKIVERLSLGKIVVMFPEGFVHPKDNNIYDFKNGATLIAWKAKTKIIPVYIKQCANWYGHPFVIVGSPVDTSVIGDKIPNMSKASKLTLDIQEKIIELKNKLPDYT